MRLTFRFFLAVAVALSAANRGRTEPLTLSAPTARAASGQEVELPITLKGPSGIGALHLELVYDPSILECKTVEKGQLLNGNSLLEADSSQSGRLVVGIVSLDGIPGDGCVLKARFVTRGPAGQKTPLRLEHVEAWDGKTHLDLLAKVEAGEFTVVNAGLFSSWPWLVGIGVAVLLLFTTIVAVQTRKAQPRA
jgi:hypothetical protein